MTTPVPVQKEDWLAVWLLALSIASYFMKYILNIFLANYLEARFYGDISIALRALTIFATISLLGTTFGAKRFLAYYIRIQDKLNIQNYVRWNLKLIAYTFSICLLVALVSVGLMLTLDLLNIRALSEYHVVAYMLWIAPLAALVLLIASYLASTRHTVIAYTCRKIGRYIIMLGFFMISVLLLELPLDNKNIFIILLLTFTVLACIELAFLFTKMPSLFSLVFKEKPKKRDKEKEHQWLKFSSRLIINNVAFLIICILDLIIVEIFSSSEKYVGYYSAVLIIAGALWVIPQGIFQFFKLQISSLVETSHGRKLLQKQLDSINIIFFIAATILTCLLMLFSKTLLLHFGEEYLFATPTLFIALIGTYIGIYSQSPIILLVYSGNESLLLKVNYVEVGLLLVFGIPLTYAYNIIGAAVAYAISVSLKTFIVAYYARKLSGIKPLWLF